MREANPAPPAAEGLLEAAARRPDAVRWIRPIEAVQRDFILAVTRPVVVGQFWVDLAEAQRFVRDWAGPPKLTLTHLLVKATALAALASPAAHRMFGPLHAVDPGHADVGVSVEGREVLSALAVIREADRKPLAQIAEELRAKAAEVRAAELRDHPRIERYLGFLRFFPFPQLSRLVARAFLLSPSLRRKAAGTVQFSNIGHFGIDAAHVPVVAELLLVGGVLQKRAVVDEEDRIVVATGAEFTIHGSHRKLNGQTGGRLIAAFRELMSHPERLA